MKYKFEVIENSLVVTDTIKNQIVLDVPKSNVYYESSELNKANACIYSTTLEDKHEAVLFICKLSQATNSDGAVFTKETFLEFSRKNLSTSTALSSTATVENNATPSEEINTSIPINEVTITNDIVTVNSEASKHNGLVTGATNGRHLYIFNGLKNILDVTATTTEATLLPGANVEITALGDASKNITGNSWNSSVYSQESFDPNLIDFAVTVEIESVTGTIREMFGLDDNPTQNNSYNSIEYAVYQVNNYFYSRVYEKGAAKIIPNYTTFYFQVGDQVGVKCVNGVVSYFVLRNGVETVIYTASEKATSPLYFKAAFNRGNSSSGASFLGGVKFYTATKQDSFTVKLDGVAGELVSETHKTNLKFAGIDLLTGSTYSKLQFKRIDSDKFKDSQGFLKIDLAHSYIGLYNTVSKVINH